MCKNMCMFGIPVVKDEKWKYLINIFELKQNNLKYQSSLLKKKYISSLYTCLHLNTE